MDNLRILPGDELVARGTTKIDASLPERGLKEVVPNGSWLEQKQIQSALEARKQLIDVQRIEKCGVLSHAEWREELQLAEVIQKAGSHWQFLGHNVGKQLFLKPEEALFLMEVNCLILKHNEVTVSLQQAYTLLLRGKISLLQYKVYASLSRLGYKVFGHEESKPIDNKNEFDSSTNMDVNENKEIFRQEKNEGENKSMELDSVMKISDEAVENRGFDQKHISNGDSRDKSHLEVVEVDCDSESSNVKNDLDQNIDTIGSEVTSLKVNGQETNGSEKINNEWVLKNTKLRQLKNRKVRPSDLITYIDGIPDMSQNKIVTLKAPEELYIPKNIFLNNITYVLNVANIKSNNKSLPVTNTPRPYSANEEINGAHVRRLSNNRNDSWNNVNNQNQNWIPPFSNQRFLRPQFRPFGFWRPQSNINFFQYHVLFRPFMPNMNFSPRFNAFSGPPPLIGYSPNLNSNRNIPSNSRKRSRDNARRYHYQAIKRLGLRLKQLIQSGNTQIQNIQALQRLVDTYNTRYRTSLRLTEQYDIVEDDNIIETIQLDDDEETANKRQRKDTIDHYDENLNRLKLLAIRFKDLETESKASNRHKRAFSNVVKKFNKSYNAELYVNSNYEIIDPRHIVLDNSSESDCVIEEKMTGSTGKKLRNPFNILKRLSEKRNSSISDVNASIEITDEGTSDKYNRTYCEDLKKCFDKSWLPNENDFGRVETIPQSLSYEYLINSRRDQYLYDFIKTQDFVSWLDAKIAFYRHIQDSAEATAFALQDKTCDANSGLSPLVKPEKSTDMISILNMLSVISSCKSISSETTLSIDFDVYNRDVKNFRKSNRPKPHFRVICIDESSDFPSGCDVATLHSRYDDGVAILFGVLGIASISYLQIIPSDIPTYIPTNSDSMV